MCVALKTVLYIPTRRRQVGPRAFDRTTERLALQPNSRQNPQMLRISDERLEIFIGANAASLMGSVMVPEGYWL